MTNLGSCRNLSFLRKLKKTIPVNKYQAMRPTNHKKPLSYYAAKWHTSVVTASNYARRGCDWDASDYDVAVWLLKYSRKRSPAMRAAIYAVPGISDPIAPEQAVTISKRSEDIDCHAWGKLITLCCDTEAAVEKLKHGDTQEALRLRREVAKLEAMTAKLRDENFHLWSM